MKFAVYYHNVQNPDETKTAFTHRFLSSLHASPDNRRHPAMCHFGERYPSAKLTSIMHTCRCGKDHENQVYEDGTMFCERMDAFLVANFETPDLVKMRKGYEDNLIALIRATELN